LSALRIVPIVEGHGEERAVPVLVRGWLQFRNFHQHFEVPDRAINAKGSGRLKGTFDPKRHVGIEHYVQAALRNNPAAILVVLDADDECQRRVGGAGLGPELLVRAKSIDPRVPVAVVVANREYEAWFLASLRSMRTASVLSKVNGKLDPTAPEAIRDCKGLVADLMGCPYEETVHQLELTRHLSFSKGPRNRCASLSKLVRDLERLTSEARRLRRT
jgi:Domain of unknown function (DUF4276)